MIPNQKQRLLQLCGSARMKPSYFQQAGLEKRDFVAVCLRVIVPRTLLPSTEERVAENAVETDGAIGTLDIQLAPLTTAEWDWIIEVLDLVDQE